MSKKHVLLYALLRQELSFFIDKTFRTVSPGVPYLRNWHIDAIAHHLALCSQGEITRLIITMPPRHLKSISASVAFIAWQLGHKPTSNIIAASYSQDLSTWHHNNTRRVMESEWYQRCFPGTRIDPKKNTQSDFRTTKNGGRFATSVGGTLTGIGGNIIVIDDPHKTDEVESEVKRKSVIDWFRSNVLTRLDDKRQGAIIVIQQRQHENDLAGYLLEQGGWVHLNLPAIAIEDEAIPIGDGKFYRRLEGDVLHPEREGLDDLNQLKRDMGSYAFSAQYQQLPTPMGGGFIKWEWFPRYWNTQLRFPDDRVVQSWDTAHAVADTNDYSVCLTFLCRKNVYYLINVYRDRLLYPDLKRAVISMAKRFDPDLIIVEGSNSGKDLREDIFATTRLNIKYLVPKGDKVSRMAIGTGVIEAGRLWLPGEASWLPEFQHEIVTFPNGKHDDQVDALSQFLRWAVTMDLRHYPRVS